MHGIDLVSRAVFLPAMEILEFARTFRRLVADSDEVRELLHNQGWQDVSNGPCYMVARGIQNVLGGDRELHATCVRCAARRCWIATHIVVEADGWYLDGKGAHTVDELRDFTWSESYFANSGYVRPRWALLPLDGEESIMRPMAYSLGGVETFEKLAKETLSKVNDKF